MDGILPVWKKAGITSYDVIRVYKRAEHPDYKVGHGGTLDPFAEGVLLLLLGKATKKMNELSALSKTYMASAVLGAKSDTLDGTGNIKQCHSDAVTRKQIVNELKKWVGEYEQVIPDYSAAKVNGVARYKLARKGIAQEQKSKKVRIKSLKLISYEGERVVFETTVSSGTYIRQLSYDILKKLGSESYLEKLVRSKIGDYGRANCATISQLEQGEWRDKLEC